MAVKIGSARMGSNGHTTGDKAGDQGSEVSTQSWYAHNKGWVLLRAKDPRVRAGIAIAMQAACDNKHIGYDQNQRLTLLNAVKALGYDPAKCTKDVETDCSALVRVCILYAQVVLGMEVKDPGNFRTATQVNMVMATGMFDKYTDDNHCKKSDYLAIGDILVTKTSGHTVVVLSNGSKCDADQARGYRKGDKGTPVKDIQKMLMTLGYSLPKYGADGDFGSETDAAVKKFQSEHGFTANGIVDDKVMAKLDELYFMATAKTVVVTGKSVNVRSNPSTHVAIGKILGVVHEKDVLPYQGEVKDEFYLVEYNGQNAWITTKYTKLGV